MLADVREEVARCWNCGMELEETVSYIMKVFNKIGHKMTYMNDKQRRGFTEDNIRSIFKSIDAEGCIPGRKPKNSNIEKMSEEYKIWKGISGPGALAREIIKQVNEQRI